MGEVLFYTHTLSHTYTRHPQQKWADTHMSLLCTPPRQPFCNTWHNRAGQSLARSHALPLHSYKCVRVRGGSRQLRQDIFSLGCCDHIFCDFKWGGGGSRAESVTKVWTIDLLV
jgi:hypothetical protein